jgi:hypothetical protein
MYWEKADGGYGNATLDANTGKELQLSATLGTKIWRLARFLVNIDMLF